MCSWVVNGYGLPIMRLYSRIHAGARARARIPCTPVPFVRTSLHSECIMNVHQECIAQSTAREDDKAPQVGAPVAVPDSVHDVGTVRYGSSAEERLWGVSYLVIHASISSWEYSKYGQITFKRNYSGRSCLLQIIDVTRVLVQQTRVDAEIGTTRALGVTSEQRLAKKAGSLPL